MSFNALTYVLDENALNDSLKVCYDFGNYSVVTLGIQQGVLENIAPLSSGVNKGIIYNGTGTTTNQALNQITGANKFLSNSGSGDFSKSNILISGNVDFNLNGSSAIFQFHNINAYKNGIIFGCLEHLTETYNGVDYKSAKGINFGITDRGHLFMELFSNNGPEIHVFNNIELSPKNIVSFSIGAGEIEVCRFDYINQQTYSESFNFDTSLIINPSNIYLGASPSYYRASGIATPTFSGYINNFLLFSERLNKDTLYRVGEGLVSEYYYSSGIEETASRITGYNSIPLYNTGITGYSFSQTGYLLLPSGSSFLSGGFAMTGTYSIREGDRYFIFTSGQNPEIETYFKEEVGFLNPTLFGSYEPTGTNAFDTLGLQNSSGIVTGYTETTGFYTNYVQQPLYDIQPLTGITTEITGYSSTPLYEEYLISRPNSSGIALSGSSYGYLKNYLFYLDQ